MVLCDSDLGMWNHVFSLLLVESKQLGIMLKFTPKNIKLNIVEQ